MAQGTGAHRIQNYFYHLY